LKRLDFSTLELLVAVADAGSFSRAAVQVHLALAAVSRRITDLEASLGTVLFYRHARGVMPTPAGSAMIRHAREILGRLSRMRAEAGEFASGVRGHVRVGANTSAVTQFLPGDLARYGRDYPEVRIDLEEGLSEAIVAALADGRLDVGVFSATVPHAGLDVMPWCADQLALVVPVRHRLARRRTVSLAEVLAEPFVGLETGSSILSLVTSRSQGELRLAVQVRSFDAMCLMVQSGVGVGVLPLAVARRHARSLRVTSVPLRDEWSRRQLVVAVRDRRQLAPAAGSFFAHLSKAGAGRTQSKPASRRRREVSPAAKARFDR
jgi:DNA-binding transcriptional LysR family regulator